MNIILRELKSNRKAMLFWIIAVVSFCLLAYAEGGAFMGEDTIQELMEGMPDELMSMFSMGSYDLSTPEGYYGLLVSYIALSLAIYSVMRGCSSIISEERDKTVEFSLVLPIKRHQLLTAKLLVTFFYGIILNIVALLCGVVFGLTVEATSSYYEYIAISSVSILIIQLIFLAVGFCIGCLFRNHKRAGSLSVGILLTTYFFSMFSGMHEKLEFLKYLTPFKFFDAYEMLINMSLDIKYVFISIAISVVLIVAGYIGYQKRDMHI